MNNEIANTNLLIGTFAPITLEQMSEVRLMNRTDTKYVISLSQLNELLAFARDYYFAQETNGERLIEYSTTYFDTPTNSMLRSHVCGRTTRQKVRVRTYVSSHLTFVEIKNKRKGRTKKKRIKTQHMADETLSPVSAIFVDENANFPSAELHPTLLNNFRRITLVNKEMTERLTIDLGLMLDNLENKVVQHLDDTVIVEVKRDGRSQSHVIDWFREHKIRRHGFSKYVYGMLLTDGSEPVGVMKRKMRSLLRKGLIPEPFGAKSKWVA